MSYLGYQISTDHRSLPFADAERVYAVAIWRMPRSSVQSCGRSKRRPVSDFVSSAYASV